MQRLFSISIEILSATIILLPIILLLDKTYFYNHKKTFSCSIFIFYLTAVYSVVGLPTITYIKIEPSFNLVPFLDIIPDFKNAILNIVLFVPLGAFSPLLCESLRNFKQTILLGITTTVVIETLQIFTFRTTDINDVITNTVGTLLGYFIANKLIKRYPKSTTSAISKGTLYLLYTLTFIIMFFIQPFISSAIWNLVL